MRPRCVAFCPAFHVASRTRCRRVVPAAVERDLCLLETQTMVARPRSLPRMTAMLLDQDLKGISLPPRTLCLTYDDGPGPETRALGEYLHTEGIPATFFVIGQLAERRTELLKSLRSWGHCVGSHTYRHAGLFDLAMSGGDVVDEIARADAVLRPYVAGPVLLRPPYGSWRRKSRLDGPEDWPSSLVAERLRASGRSLTTRVP